MTEAKPDDLQFDHAEYAAAPPVSACAACGQRLWDVYYDVNGRALCEKCKTDVELAREQGSGFARFLRALIYGVGAGAVGAGIWYGIRALTHGWEFSLIAVIVGLMVGTAVKVGSSGRGGWLYQSLAVFLTYTAIVGTYIPVIVQGLHQPLGSRSLLERIVLGVLIVAFAFVAPFLGGFQNILGLLIIGFGLWEAWKINRATPLTISGPFRVGAAAPSPAPGG